MSELQDFLDSLAIPSDYFNEAMYSLEFKRREKALALAESGVDIVEPLLKLVDEENVIIRERAIRILGYLEAKQAVDKLLQVVQNTNEQKGVRSFAVEALSNIKDRRAIPPLLSLLEDENTEINIRWSIIEGAANFEDKSFVEPLKRILREASDHGVRRLVVQALGREGLATASSFDVILGVIQHDADLEVRLDAIQTLDKFADVRAVDILLNLFHDTDPSLRFVAVRTLAMSDFQGMRINDALLPLLDDSYAGVRYWAAAGLSYRQETRAIARIRQMLASDPNPNVRGEAVHSLIALIGKDALPDLTKALEDDEYAQDYEEKVSTLARQTIARLQSRDETQSNQHEA